MNRLYFFIIFAFLFSRLLLGNIINIPADYSTIQVGIDTAQVEDTVLVAPGTYVENIDFHGKKLIVASNFIYSKNKTDIINSTIDGNSDSSVVSIENFEPAGTSLIGFTIQNGLGTGDWPNVRGGGIHISRGATPTIKNCIITDNECIGNSNRGAGIYANSSFAYISNCEVFNNTALTGGGIMIGNGANGTVVDSCEIYNNDTYSALTIAYSQFVVINRTLIHHNSQIGLRNFGTDSVTVMQGVIANNGDMGVTNQSDDSQVYLFNSFVGYNEGDNVEQDTSRRDNWVDARYSNIMEGTDSLWFGIGCIDTMPEFADTANYDYSLLSTSPMIDAGDPMLPNDDDGTVADIGVHFFSQGTSSLSGTPLTLDKFELEQNYPNPFNPTTTISYRLKKSSHVEIEIFNMMGQKVKTLLNKIKSAGSHIIQFDANGLASGVYPYKLETEGFSQIKKMILLR
jgi:hypothetical protein